MFNVLRCSNISAAKGEPKKPDGAAVDGADAKPDITQGLEPIEMIVGQPAQMAVKVADGLTKPSIKWLACMFQ